MSDLKRRGYDVSNVSFAFDSLHGGQLLQTFAGGNDTTLHCSLIVPIVSLSKYNLFSSKQCLVLTPDGGAFTET